MSKRLANSKFAKNFNDKFPIITIKVPGWEKINPILEQGIRSLGDKQNHSSNVKADMTDWKMWEPHQPAHAEFTTICKFAMSLAVEHSPEPAKPHFQPLVTECWGAVYRAEEFTKLHDHWPSVWSFTYYVNVSDECSPIVFPDAQIAVKPKNGMMCMFPGWVGHKVPKQKGNHERVMIAGNISQNFGVTG